jgi:hypothetical protein
MHDGVRRVNSKTLQEIRHRLLQRSTVPEGPHGESEDTHAWWKVMCLTGLDYFSTLGYQLGIATGPIEYSCGGQPPRASEQTQEHP